MLPGMVSGWSVRENFDRQETERHVALLEAARRVLERKGVGATSITDIAAEAGVSRATVYVYFASKREIVTRLAKQVRDSVAQAQSLRGLDHRDIETVLAATVEATLRTNVENLAFLSVLQHEARVDPDLNSIWTEIRDQPTQRTANYLDSLTAQGLIEPVTDTLAIARLGAAMNAYLAPLIDSGQLEISTAVQQILRLLLAAVR